MATRSWAGEGWSDDHWDAINDTVDEVRLVVSGFESMVGGGGGGIEPADLAEFAIRLQTVAARLQRISCSYR